MPAHEITGELAGMTSEGQATTYELNLDSKDLRAHISELLGSLPDGRVKETVRRGLEGEASRDSHQR